MASAALPKILLDGQEIARLGIGEMERMNISPGPHKIQTKIGNVLQLGITGDASSFVAGLELVREGDLLIKQEELFDKVYLKIKK